MNLCRFFVLFSFQSGCCRSRFPCFYSCSTFALTSPLIFTLFIYFFRFDSLISLFFVFRIVVDAPIFECLCVLQAGFCQTQITQKTSLFYRLLETRKWKQQLKREIDECKTRKRSIRIFCPGGFVPFSHLLQLRYWLLHLFPNLLSILPETIKQINIRIESIPLCRNSQFFAICWFPVV